MLLRPKKVTFWAAPQEITEAGWSMQSLQRRQKQAPSSIQGGVQGPATFPRDSLIDPRPCLANNQDQGFLFQLCDYLPSGYLTQVVRMQAVKLARVPGVPTCGGW